MNHIDWELVNWSRAQFALTAMYHWLFVPLTLGITFIIAIMETIAAHTGKCREFAFFEIDNGKLLRGITICGSGNGISMVVNKYPKVRAALCWNTEIMKLARSHNDANICSLPARYINDNEAIDIINAFLSTPFEGGRHIARINKIPIQK